MPLTDKQIIYVLVLVNVAGVLYFGLIFGLNLIMDRISEVSSELKALRQQVEKQKCR